MISALNLKFGSIEFKMTLPKHHAGIGAEKRIIGSIKNTVRKSVTGPNQLKMDDEELHTWLNMVIEKINDRPLILGAPLGITLTPNHILLGFRNTHGDEINPDIPVHEFNHMIITSVLGGRDLILKICMLNAWVGIISENRSTWI